MRIPKFGLVAAVIGSLTIVGGASAQPDIGGMPIHTQENEFSDGSLWGMTVWSYVFDADSALPEGFILDPGEMLFAYFLDGDDTKEVSVDSFSVGNPNLMPITSVGFETGIVPSGYDAEDVEEPFLFGYSGPAQATIYTYSGDMSDPFSTLDPQEWSLVWYIAEAPTWSLGSATASGAGISDNHDLPVPTVPSPGPVVLLGLAAGLVGFGRRSR